MSHVVLETSHHPAGEYRYEAPTLALSIPLARCKVEMASEGQRWSGTTERGDIKVMVPGEERVFRHGQGCTFLFLALDAELVHDVAPRGLRPHAAPRGARACPPRPWRHPFGRGGHGGLLRPEPPRAPRASLLRHEPGAPPPRSLTAFAEGCSRTSEHRPRRDRGPRAWCVP